MDLMDNDIRGKFTKHYENDSENIIADDSPNLVFPNIFHT